MLDLSWLNRRRFSELLAALSAAGLSPYEISVYFAIFAHADGQGKCFPALPRIAELSRVSYRKTIEAIKTLEEKDLLTVTRFKPGKGVERSRNHYELKSIPAHGAPIDCQIPAQDAPLYVHTVHPIGARDDSLTGTKNEHHKRKEEKPSPSFEIEDQAIQYLNTRTGKAFRTTAANRKHISARIRDGFTLDDMKRVVDAKVATWRDDSKMREYLRPQTIFGTKFESYLNAAPAPKPQPVDEGPVVDFSQLGKGAHLDQQ
jgi:uncharacterized phage protein (TIGR02220 family)